MLPPIERGSLPPLDACPVCRGGLAKGIDGYRNPTNDLGLGRIVVYACGASYAERRSFVDHGVLPSPVGFNPLVGCERFTLAQLLRLLADNAPSTALYDLLAVAADLAAETGA
jgi:hypothetical protein